MEERRPVYASLVLLIITVIIVGWASSIAYAQATATLPAPWVAQDIGNPPPTGSSIVNDNNEFEISASGGEVSSTGDQLRFVYQMLADDVRIAVRVDSLLPALTSSTAGLMIRTSLQAGARQASVVMSGDGQLSFQRRKQDGGVTTNTNSAVQGSVPQWLGLERRGTRVFAYASSDGQTWTLIGSDWITLGTDVYVGLAVSSQDQTENASARMSQVAASGLRVGQRQRDIGWNVTGSGSQTQGTYSIKSRIGNAIISDAQDRLHFVYQQIQGDVDVVARVASLQSLNRGAEAGVMIRESLRSDSRHAFAAITSGNGYTFDRRLESVLLTEHADGGAGAVPGWVRLVRSGENFEAFRSSDGVTWTSMGSTTIAMGEQAYVGLAVASQAANTETTAVIDHFSAGAVTTEGTGDIGGLPNLPPTVTLITPVNGATFEAPATITLTALAADPELRLANVKFYANSNLIGMASTLPYTFTWSSVAAGSYTLTAVAADADGGTTTSAAVSITVQAAANQPPTVALTAPANGATFTAPATITLTASASDPENRLARVDFFRGSTQLGSATASPYSFTWSSVPAGSYTLTAVATDADGGTTTSAAVSITVEAPANQPPTVALTAPANGATFTAPATITLTASASDPENRLARVDFFRGSTLLGSDTGSPYSFTWSSVPAGSYTLTAVAVDADGATATSAAINITVAATQATWRAAFTASADHDIVTSYLLEVFASGADVNTSSPIASTDLGKPTPDANRDITVDETSFFGGLAAGNYLVTVSAIASEGRARSAPVSFTR